MAKHSMARLNLFVISFLCVKLILGGTDGAGDGRNRIYR